MPFQNASVSCQSEGFIPLGWTTATHVRVWSRSIKDGELHAMEACALGSSVQLASAFPFVFDACPTAFSPSPTGDAHDQNHAPCVHADDSIPSSEFHAHVQGALIQIPIHEFQSHVQALRLLPTHLHRGDRFVHPHRDHVHGEPHATWPNLPFR